VDAIRQERSADPANVVGGGSSSDMVLVQPLAEGDNEGMLQLNGECFSFRFEVPEAKFKRQSLELGLYFHPIMNANEIKSENI